MSEESRDRPAPTTEQSERVRAARVARHRRWADLQVEEAMRRGDFDDLPSAGRPLDLGDRHDPDWWLKRLIAREQIEGTTPPAIALRLEDERLDALLDGELAEREVRRRVEDFNKRVRDARRQLLGGPPVITPLRDPDLEVQRWRERRARRRATAAAEREAAAARSERTRGRRRRGGRTRILRRRPPEGDRGAAAPRAVVAGVAAAALAGAGAWVLLAGPDDPAPAEAAPAAPATSEAAGDSSPDLASSEESGGDPSPAAAATDAPVACSTARRGFRPVSVTIPGVQRDIEVVYPARDARGIPGTPPLSTEGKAQMAFDRANDIPPGAPRGNALFNAHTWPDGSALGNRLLEDLQEGDELRVQGAGGQVLCYELVRRVEVPATVSGAQYYRRDGAPRMAVVVCSGDRDASGNWSHRTLFFAAPRA